MKKFNCLLAAVGIFLSISAFCGQPQLSPVALQADQKFARASQQQRNMFIMRYWQMVVEVFTRGDARGQKFVSDIAPVIQKYDPAFAMHFQEAEKAIMQAIYMNAMQVPSGLSMKDFVNNHLGRGPFPGGGASPGCSPVPGNRRQCGGCHGSGRCRACNGTGIVSAKYGGSDFPCSCHNGNCVVCDGRGWF